MTELELAQLIESYLEGRLDEKEIALLQEKAKADPGIAAEISLRKELEIAIAEEDVLKLESKLIEERKKGWANNNSSQQGAKAVPILLKYRALAAGLAVIIVCALVLFLKNQDPKDLYEAYYQPYPMYLTTRSVISPDEKLNQAIQAYEQENYEVAWSSFLNILVDDPDNMGIMFYTAMSALQIDRYPDAVAGLKKVANQGDSIYSNPAEWYLGLALFKSGDVRNARKVFENIVESKTDFSEDAKSILKSISTTK